MKEKRKRMRHGLVRIIDEKELYIFPISKYEYMIAKSFLLEKKSFENKSTNKRAIYKLKC